MNNGRQPQNWLPYAGLIAMALGIVYNSGQLTSRINDNTDRIVELKAQYTTLSAAASTTNERMARIEVKLDLLLDEKQDRKVVK